MKKYVLVTACLLLSVGIGAADCDRSTATSAVTIPPPNFSPVQEPAPDLGDLSVLGSAVELGPGGCDCYTICEQTPTGCSCEGFVCDGFFYCAIPVC